MQLLAKAFLTIQLLELASSTNLTTKEARIIGGFEAIEDRHSYSVSLRDHFSKSHFCGGSLILKDVILTAAHCLGGSIDVLIGRHDFDDEDGELIAAKWQVQHPSYNKATDENDIALLVLERPVETAVSLVTLNSDASYPAPGDVAHVMGWGNTDSGSSTNLPDEMQMVDVEVISNEVCVGLEKGGTSYEQYGFDITDDMICTFTANKDACQGDSGGPLVITGDDASQDVQVGVVSWGVGCAYLPGVYSRTSYAYDWIQDMACKLSSDTTGSNLCGTPLPTMEPTEPPTLSPTPQPTPTPTPQPTNQPTNEPTVVPTETPTFAPSPFPSSKPSTKPTVSPSSSPSNSPTISPEPTYTPTLPVSRVTTSFPTTTVDKETRIDADGLMISAEALANEEGNISNSSNTLRIRVIGSALSLVLMTWLVL